MPARYTVNQVLPNGATVTSDLFTTDADGTTHETMVATYPSGQHDTTVITIPGAGTPAANAATIQAKTQTALVNNVTYLSAAVPTVAQTTAQLNALTRAVNALIYIVNNQYTSTTGT